MAIINNLSKTYNNEYSTWRESKDLNAAKRQEYLRRNPDAIKDYDLQRAKILISATEMMDKSLKENSNKIKIAYESIMNLGLAYAAIGGTLLGHLATKTKFVKNFIEKSTPKYPHSKNLISMGITAISGIVGVLAVYPLYNSLSKGESQIHRKRKFETMEEELKDPKIFVVLDAEQKKIFKENLPELNQDLAKYNTQKELTKEYESWQYIQKEALNYEKEQSDFKEKYREDESLYENQLSEKEIKNAIKDKGLLSILLKEINTKSQSYNEKMREITDNLITFSFALGSLFTLGYEQLAKKLKVKSSSIPAGMGMFLLAISTFFATWAQRRASHVGRFKAIQELKENPEQLVYVSKQKMNTIEDNEINVKERHKTNIFKFLKDFFKHNEEYKNWKKTEIYSGSDISKAMENIEISPEQLKDGKRLQKNMFKTFYKVDINTQKYSSDIDVLSESIKFPISLIFGSIGSVWGMKHLAKLRSAIKPQDIFKESVKYIGTISLFTLPSLVVNSYFAKAQKMGARISDMMTMKELEDYRFFADYSRFIENK